MRPAPVFGRGGIFRHLETFGQVAGVRLQDRERIELTNDERIVLRELLTNTDLSEYGGLKKLAQVLQAVAFTEPLESEEPAKDA